MISRWARQLVSDFTCTVLFFKWDKMVSGLPLVFMLWPNPTGILIEWPSRTSVSKALKREVDCVTFSQTFKTTYAESWSFHLKVIPIALFLMLISLRIEMPTVSESLQFRKACSHRSVTLSWKWVMGSLSSDGGNRRTVSYVPTVLNRLYCLVISSTIVNLWPFITWNTNYFYTLRK